MGIQFVNQCLLQTNNEGLLSVQTGMIKQLLRLNKLLVCLCITFVSRSRVEDENVVLAELGVQEDKLILPEMERFWRRISRESHFASSKDKNDRQDESPVWGRRSYRRTNWVRGTRTVEVISKAREGDSSRREKVLLRSTLRLRGYTWNTQWIHRDPCVIT